MAGGVKNPNELIGFKCLAVNEASEAAAAAATTLTHSAIVLGKALLMLALALALEPQLATRHTRPDVSNVVFARPPPLPSSPCP